MFSFSTSWNSSRHKRGIDLINEIKALGFDTVELNFALTKDVVDEIASLKDRSSIKVSSLHNMCPLPDGIEPKDASPDYYSLASPDEKERAMAVRAAKNTIDYAERLEARAVVLHAGRVAIKDRMRFLASLKGDARRFEAFKKDMVEERKAKAPAHLKYAVDSLRKLAPYAAKKGIRLAVENRYYYREIPLFEELEEIFRNFESGELFYWHDVGHAEVFERLGLRYHKDLLEAFQKRLLGIHLHDIIGLMQDHQAPGFGTFDFRTIRPYIKKDTMMVIEAHAPATADQIRQGVKFLKKVLD